MQNALRLGLVLLFLVITVKSHAALPPSTQPVWPTAESLARHRVSLDLNEVKNLSFTQFQQKIKKIQKLFPRIDDHTLASSGELPKRLLESGYEMRELRKISQHNSKLSRNGLAFFVQCSRDQELISTLHSVCLSHALKLSSELNHEIQLSDYPKKVVELAQIAL